MAIDPFANCNFSITDCSLCTLETCCLAQASFLYLTNFSGNLFFAIFFVVLIISSLLFGISYRTWAYMACMICGLVLEVIGYAARVWLHEAPFSSNAFLIYLICLTIAPVFFTAAIYLCLTRLIILYGAHNTRCKPKSIAVGFMTSDFLSLVLQGAGGGITDTAITTSLKQTGVDLMITGLVLQCASLLAFILVVVDFALRCHNGSLSNEQRKIEIRDRPVCKAFVAALVLSTVFVFIRSTYRAIELWQGFNGFLWNNEVDFMVLDGTMVGLACLLLSTLHPGLALREQWQAADWRNEDVALGPTGEATTANQGEDCRGAD